MPPPVPSDPAACTPPPLMWTLIHSKSPPALIPLTSSDPTSPRRAATPTLGSKSNLQRVLLPWRLNSMAGLLLVWIRDLLWERILHPGLWRRWLRSIRSYWEPWREEQLIVAFGREIWGCSVGCMSWGIRRELPWPGKVFVGVFIESEF